MCGPGLCRTIYLKLNVLYCITFVCKRDRVKYILTA